MSSDAVLKVSGRTLGFRGSVGERRVAAGTRESVLVSCLADREDVSLPADSYIFSELLDDRSKHADSQWNAPRRSIRCA